MHDIEPALLNEPTHVENRQRVDFGSDPDFVGDESLIADLAAELLTFERDKFDVVPN
jgi:hypothetical protein